jgi:hypothetical protein
VVIIKSLSASVAKYPFPGRLIQIGAFNPTPAAGARTEAAIICPNVSSSIENVRNPAAAPVPDGQMISPIRRNFFPAVGDHITVAPVAAAQVANLNVEGVRAPSHAPSVLINMVCANAFNPVALPRFTAYCPKKFDPTLLG